MPREQPHRRDATHLAAEATLPIEAVRRHLAACIDLIVHVERSAAGHREIREIAEVQPLAPGAPEVSLRTLVARGVPQSTPRRGPRSSDTAPFTWVVA